MSNYYLCAQCGEFLNWVYVVDSPLHVDCYLRGIVEAKVMTDHGHANGQEPYDDPLDICPLFRKGMCE